MDLLHSTWFWCVVAAAPFVMAIGTLVRLARCEAPPSLPPGVCPGSYRRHDDAVLDDTASPQSPDPKER